MPYLGHAASLQIWSRTRHLEKNAPPPPVGPKLPPAAQGIMGEELAWLTALSKFPAFAHVQKRGCTCIPSGTSQRGHTGGSQPVGIHCFLKVHDHQPCFGCAASPIKASILLMYPSVS